ncbi:MAG: B12-binding domain-containing radical SAM protein [Deltaproteobacteria bacterium]|nr:B12-binding domain-containing radical SAM protein [Deltaproteobacteria bacterium]
MKIVLYKPLVRPEINFNPVKKIYLGFSYLISYLQLNEPECSVHIAYTVEAIIDMQPDLIGISSVTEMWEITKKTVSWLRKEGFSGPVIIGGPHITALPETLPIQVDCAVIGQGEQTFLELVRVYKVGGLVALQGIPGVAYRDSDDQLHINRERVSIDLDLLPLDLHRHPSIPFQISTVRGCAFHCVHCVEHDIQKKVNHLSVERLLWMMKKRLEITRNPHFVFQDDTFLLPRGRLEQLHELMRKENLLGKVIIKLVSLNANLVEPHTIGFLKEIGVIKLGMGIESLNPRILKVMKRGVVTLDQIDRTIRYAQKENLPIGGSQVYGFPGETREEMIDSIERVRDYERRTIFKHWVCYICQPLPGSQFWEQELNSSRVSLDMDFSSLRIDGDSRFFATPWYYANADNVPRSEFISILKKYEMLPLYFFLPPNAFSKTRRAVACLGVWLRQSRKFLSIEGKWEKWRRG